MTVAKAIHELWSGYRPLAALVPSERLYTGLSPIRDAQNRRVALSYVSIAMHGEARTTRTSSGTTLRSEQVRFSIYSGTYDEARRIATAVCQFFDRRGFTFAECQALDMRPHQSRRRGRQ